MLKFASLACAALATVAWMDLAAAQQGAPAAINQTQNIKRIPLQRFDVPGTAYETVIGIAEIAQTSQLAVIPIPVRSRVI